MTTTLFPMTDEEVRVWEDTQPHEDDSNKSARAHLVNPAMNIELQRKLGFGMNAQAIVGFARQFGLEVVALCGYRWVPKLDAKGLPICDACLDVASDIYDEEG